MEKFVEHTEVTKAAEAALKLLSIQQYSPAWIKKQRYIYNRLVRFAKAKYNGVYSAQAGKEFVDSATCNNRPLSAGHLRTYVLAIQRIDKLLDGETDWYPRGGPERTDYSQSRFSAIVENYEEYLRDSKKAEGSIRPSLRVVSNFLGFLDLQGLEDLQDLTVQDIYKAFETAKTKITFHKWVSGFLRYAYRYGLIKRDFSAIVPSVRRHKTIPSVYSPEEIEILLNAFDRDTPAGKRNFAIALIAARLGLRACDICGLMFDNIDLSGRVIKIIQIKTKEPIELPIMPDVKDALLDYVNNARPESNDSHIFLKKMHLRGQPMEPSYLSSIVSRAFSRTTINLKGRRHGPHSLRSSLATALLDEGNNIPTIQRVLGQTHLNSPKPYIQVDITHLRACALEVPAPGGNFAALLLDMGVGL